MTLDEQRILKKFGRTGGTYSLEQLRLYTKLAQAQFDAAMVALIKSKLLIAWKAPEVGHVVTTSKKGWHAAAALLRPKPRNSAASASSKTRQNLKPNDQ